MPLFKELIYDPVSNFVEKNYFFLNNDYTTFDYVIISLFYCITIFFIYTYLIQDSVISIKFKRFIDYFHKSMIFTIAVTANSLFIDAFVFFWVVSSWKRHLSSSLIISILLFLGEICFINTLLKILLSKIGNNNHQSFIYVCLLICCIVILTVYALADANLKGNTAVIFLISYVIPTTFALKVVLMFLMTIFLYNMDFSVPKHNEITKERIITISEECFNENTYLIRKDESMQRFD